MEKIVWYKNRKIVFPVAVIVIIVTLVAIFSRKDAPTYDIVKAEKTDMIQEVSVTGNVQAADKVDLAFEQNGRIARVNIKVGDHVKSGQELVVLDNADITAQLRQAQASVASASAQLQQYEAALDTQYAKLDELKRGTRPEETQIAETNLFNTKKNLEDAEKNLKTIQSKTVTDLQEDYESALTALSKSMTVGKAAMLTLTDIQYAHFSDVNPETSQIADEKEKAVEVLLGQAGAGRYTTDSLSRLNGGIYGQVQGLSMESTSHDQIDQFLDSCINALQKIKHALDVVRAVTSLSSAERTNLETEKANVNAEITTLTNKQQAILTQKATNENSLRTAESEVTQTKNALASAQNELDLKLAGATAEQIQGQEAQVKQAKANVASQQAMVQKARATVQQYEAQLEKTVLRAPMDGIVTKQEGKVGEIVALVTSSRTVVSLISEANFEIEANIPEVDIAKVQIGDNAKVTLDAYGNDVEFNAKVMEIDPAETIVDGVPTYKITLQFVSQDERIRSGMTANIDIRTDERKGVIAVSQRAVISNDGNKLVKILKGGVVKEVTVKTGMRSLDGRIEIVDGVSEGDQVIVSTKEK